ncbi:MAG: hypothetical protein CVV42_02315 [Candidatus Riflebacteria bacterium HGW-Riflebacteria-2]|jgi:hypothetical protein|nr:MAG: hypothetical protein CVV42_02315 [Candidatus Riflebacteria bacterium HGW-Riflebacteria-2]
MRLAQAFSLGAWLIVTINLLMAFGAIGVFTRMTPAIAEIISNNERSLQACEEMLTALVKAAHDKGDKKLAHSQNFKKALERAKHNVTEGEEPAALDTISSHYEGALAGSKQALETTTAAILTLSKINRDAMANADKKAQQLGRGGAWGIVFMAVFVFIAGILFIQQLNSKLLKPLEEIKTVLLEHQTGETRRRCAAANLPTDIRSIFGSINSLLDRTTHDFSNNR